MTVSMKAGSENQGEFGWYEGDLQYDSFTGNYRLSQGMNSASVPGNEFIDEVFEARKDHGIDVMLYGCLGIEEGLTGGLDFEMLQVDEAAAVIEEEYDGWTVGVSGYDLVFSKNQDFTVYEADSIEGLERNLADWFDEPEEYVEKVEGWERELNNWPWKL
jgi:hypothetical protein